MKTILVVSMLLAAGALQAEDAPKAKAEFDIGLVFQEAGMTIPHSDPFVSLKALFESPTAKKTVPTERELTGWFMGHTLYSQNRTSLSNALLIGRTVSWLDDEGRKISRFLVWTSPYTGDSRSGIESLRRETLKNLSCMPLIFPVEIQTHLSAKEAAFSSTVEPAPNVSLTQAFTAVKIGPYLLVREMARYSAKGEAQEPFEAAYSVFFKSVSPKEDIDCAKRGTDI
ncbi:MAG: hypothetical protein AAB036_05785 [Elusimicrobiota bacterium]